MDVGGKHCRIRYLAYVIVFVISFQVMLTGCYTYKYYEFCPSDIPVDEGTLSFLSEKCYYDSLSQNWKTMTGDDLIKADTRWDIYVWYHVKKGRPTFYQLEIDTLHIMFDSGLSAFDVPISFNRLTDFNPGFGSAVFGPIRFEEDEFPEFTVYGTLEMKELDSDKVLKTFPFMLKAKLKKRHGTYLMR